MHVPGEDHGAETEPAFGDREEFRLRHYLSTELPIDVYAGDFDFGVVLEEGGKVFEGWREGCRHGGR